MRGKVHVTFVTHYYKRSDPHRSPAKAVTTPLNNGEYRTDIYLDPALKTHPKLRDFAARHEKLEVEGMFKGKAKGHKFAVRHQPHFYELLHETKNVVKKRGNR